MQVKKINIFNEDFEEAKRTEKLSKEEKYFKWCTLLIQRQDSIFYFTERYPQTFKSSKEAVEDLVCKCENPSKMIFATGCAILSKIWWSIPEERGIHVEPTRTHFFALCGFLDQTWESWNIKSPEEYGESHF